MNSYKEYNLMAEEPIWIAFPEPDQMHIGESISRTIVLIGTDPQCIAVNYAKNCPDFDVKPDEFKISKDEKIQLVLTWTKTSQEKLRTSLRFQIAGMMSRFFFINCFSKYPPEIIRETRSEAESSELSLEGELRELEKLVFSMAR